MQEACLGQQQDEMDPPAAWQAPKNYTGRGQRGGSSDGYQSVNATRYWKLPAGSGQDTTCRRNQQGVGGRGGVLIYARMNTNYDRSPRGDCRK